MNFTDLREMNDDDANGKCPDRNDDNKSNDKNK